MIKRTITVHSTEGGCTENTTRIEYKDHVIQILAQNDTVWHCVLSKDGQSELFETTDLLKCFEFLDN